MVAKQTSYTKIIFSLSYWFGSHSLGLILHPYQSTRRLVRDQFYRPLVFLPGLILSIWWLAGTIIARFNVLATLRLEFFATALDLLTWKQYLFVFIYLTGFFFLVYWQIVLFYLYKRFTQAFREEYD